MVVSDRVLSASEENSFLVFKGKTNDRYEYLCTLCGTSNTCSRKYGYAELPVSCGCSKKFLPTRDYTGQIINGIFIVGYIGASLWRVESSCGCIEDSKLTKVRARTNSECANCRYNNNEIHGHAKRGDGGHTREYNSWCNLRRRCRDPANNRYKYYGDAGIYFCTRWESFKLFLEDMGYCPAGFSIERIKVDEGYSKENCIWVDNKTQANNKTNNILITDGKECMSMMHWCKLLQIDYKQAHYRFKYKGLSIEMVLGEDYRLARDKFDV